MELALAIISLCLLVAFLIILIRYIGYKKQIKKMAKEVQKLSHDEYTQPIKTNYFTNDMVELINAINEHIKREKELTISYYNDKKELNNIISGISHDFRTPLTASLGYIQLLRKTNRFTDEQNEYLDIIEDKNQYLKELADDFFDISTNTEVSPELKETNISNILSELTLQQYSWIEERGINITVDITENIISITDAHSIKRIIDNLFSNCRKYALSELSVSLKTKNNKAVITIANDFITEESINIEKLFQPFYRGVSRTKEGSGLGLYICKALSRKIDALIEATINDTILTITLSI